MFDHMFSAMEFTDRFNLAEHVWAVFFVLRAHNVRSVRTTISLCSVTGIMSPSGLIKVET